MGVPGLTTFIEAHSELLVPLKLQNRSVVINGNGLVHWLFYYHKQNFTFGVNYKDFEELCAKFLQTLQVCKIRAYILFDGALEDGKFQKFMKHNEKRIQAYSSVVRGSKCQLLSGFAYAVFTNVARKFRVPFCCCDFEADREVALLANALDCSVVGDDGDFFIFDIKAGYIPWNTFKWKHILKTVSTEVTAKQYIHVRCKVFYQQRFCEKFAIGKPLLPLMACLLGNDLISDQHTAHFYRHPTVTQSSQPRLRGQENAACRPKKANQKKLLDWLSSYQSSDAALRDVMKIFESGEENIGKKIQFAVQTYLLDDAESKFKNYLTDIEAFNKLPKLSILGSLPEWFVHLFRMGDLQPKFINVIFQRRYWTHLFVEDKRKPSCNRSSLHIRQAIFGMLLKNREVGTETGDDADASKSEIFGSVSDRQSNIDYVNAKKKFVIEYDRLDAGCKLTRTDIVPVEELESYGPLPNLWHIPELSCENRRALLTQVLGFNLTSIASIPSEYQLPVAVIVYWMQNADPKVSTHQLMAILLCIVRGHTCDNFRKDDDTKVLTRAKIFEVPSCASIDGSFQKGLTGGDGQNSESQTDFRNLNTSERHLSLVQACAQWQSCMQYATYLNTILQDPFPKPDITKLYHGTEISTTYYELIDFELPKQIDWICRYLQMIPKSKNAAEMFDHMYEVVTVCCKEVEPQLPDLGRFSEILQEGYVESAANVFKRKGYSIPTYDHIDETDERVICFNCGELDHKSPACSRPKISAACVGNGVTIQNSVPQLKNSTGTVTSTRSP
ncbi:single-strand DNA endonuclease ASTE1-like [Ptychodera flava]|uniref:single-strand DNA endonuclease ASTE1-like n=1 Tax=Ptychodera flava TaxID=63121 RepID=UPI003969E435